MIPICGLPINTFINSVQRPEIEDGKLKSFNLICTKKIEYPIMSVHNLFGNVANGDQYNDIWILQIDEGIYEITFSKDNVDSVNFCYLKIKGTKECSLEIADKLLNYFTKYDNTFREKLYSLDNDKFVKLVSHYINKDIWYKYFKSIEGKSPESHNKIFKDWLCDLISTYFDMDTIIKDGFLSS